MKKPLLHLLALTLAISLTACSGGGNPASTEQSGKPPSGASEQSESAAPESKTPAVPEPLSAAYVDIMKNGRFYMRYIATVTTDAGDFESEIATATDGESVATIVDTMGIKMRTLVKEDSFYQIDDASRTYMKMDIPETQMDTALTETEDLAYLGSGTDSVNGKVLPYEEYQFIDGTIRFYMDSKSLYALVVKTADGDTTMVVQEFSDKIPAGMLELQADYKETSTPAFSAGIEMDEETKREMEEMQQEFGDINLEEIQKQTEEALRQAGIDPENLPTN